MILTLKAVPQAAQPEHTQTRSQKLAYLVTKNVNNAGMKHPYAHPAYPQQRSPCTGMKQLKLDQLILASKSAPATLILILMIDANSVTLQFPCAKPVLMIPLGAFLVWLATSGPLSRLEAGPMGHVGQHAQAAILSKI